MKKTTSLLIARAAMIAAIYAVLTLAVTLTPLGTLAFGPVQVRVSEMLTVLPALTPAAVPGLFVGCIVSNLVGSAVGLSGILDVVFGSLATLLAAWLSGKMPSRWLVPLPPVIINGIVIGLVLHLTLNLPLWATMLSVAAGQAVACYGLGLPLLMVLERHGGWIFK
jgi:uncharacterized membrane protein